MAATTILLTGTDAIELAQALQAIGGSAVSYIDETSDDDVDRDLEKDLKRVRDVAVTITAVLGMATAGVKLGEAVQQYQAIDQVVVISQTGKRIMLENPTPEQLQDLLEKLDQQ
jgi:hypothetical protein